MSPAAAAVLHTAVEDILIASAANNRRDSITGLLLCDGWRFAQALEGPQDKVEACFTRICADERNVAPLVRDMDIGGRRAFPRWSMCGLTLSPRDDALLSPSDIAFDLAEAAPGALWQLLTSLALRHGAELDREHARLMALAADRGPSSGETAPTFA